MGNETSTVPSATHTSISTGVSSFSDGKNNFGTHSFVNHNGNIVHQETTGQMPSGFFSQYLPSSASTSLPGVMSMALMSIAVLTVIMAMFISFLKKGSSRSKEPNKHKILECGLQGVTSVNSDSRGFSLSSKRPLAQAMWNSNLLLDEDWVEMGEIDLNMK